MGVCSSETGVRPSFEWNSLRGSEFSHCSVALWLAEERWNENHSKLLTPAQELCRNAQLQLWCGGTEPALFLCLLRQSNRDGGAKRRGEWGRRERHKSERAGGREGGREEKKLSEQCCGLKMNICRFTERLSWNVYTGIQTASES